MMGAPYWPRAQVRVGGMAKRKRLELSPLLHPHYAKAILYSIKGFFFFLVVSGGFFLPLTLALKL